MRTTPFKKVFDRVVRMHGRDPRGEIPSDMAIAITDHLNYQVGTICETWRWPEWELTEERAFREIWNVNNQYLRASVLNGNPDEVFYLGDGFVTGGAFGANSGYYRVNGSSVSDPPVGTLPTDTNYWTLFTDSLDTYIAYDQRCRRSIGMALGVYSHNPRVPTGASSTFSLSQGLLRFRPSEFGIDVVQPGNPTVFVNYKMPTPEYTIIPYVIGKTYGKGEITFDPASGECFQALADTNVIPTDTTSWRRVPFLSRWIETVVKGAFADTLMEFDQSGMNDLQAKMVLAQYWNEDSDKMFQQEIDKLIIEGQQLAWKPFVSRTNNCWLDTQPFSGGTVSTLSSDCQDELGFVYPTPTSVPGVYLQYYNLVVALRAATSTPSLDQIQTRNLLPTSLAQIMISVGGTRTLMIFELVAGAADTADPNGQVAPLDYNSSSNAKHWEQRA